MRSVNMDGTHNLLPATQASKVTKVVCDVVDGNLQDAQNAADTSQHTTVALRNPMAEQKIEAEQLCREYIGKGLDITIVRPRTILGHGRLGIFQMLFEIWVREGRNVPVMGHGDNIFQFIHAHDLADATTLSAQKPGPRIYPTSGPTGSARCARSWRALSASEDWYDSREVCLLPRYNGCWRRRGNWEESPLRSVWLPGLRQVELL